MDASSTKSSFLCRQSSTRWIPTPDQIRILRDLYYNNGVRSPTAEQIQRITARLRQYGKIEGKNVFYWFQNHKARERQKKKLTMDHHVPTVTANADGGVHGGPCNFDGNKLTTNNTSNFDVPCHGFYDVGNGYGGGPVLMERSLIRESCLSGGGDGILMDGSNMGWMGVEPTVAPWMYHNIKEKEPPVSAAAREIETLPLFPTRSREQEDEEGDDGDEHGDQHRNFGASLHHHDHYGNGVGGAFLELTLNSYGCAPPGSM